MFWSLKAIWKKSRASVFGKHRLLKAMSDRLKRDATEREAAKDFEIKQSGELPESMRIMPSREESSSIERSE